MPSERIQRRIEHLLDAADAAIAEERWAVAKDLCERVLTLDAENEDAHALLSVAERGLRVATEQPPDPEASGARSASSRLGAETLPRAGPAAAVPVAPDAAPAPVARMEPRVVHADVVPAAPARPAGPGGPRAFVSYASLQRHQALTIADALEAAGISVWVDRTNIHGGASWSSEIVTGIQNCVVLVLCCSKAALESRNVRQEIQLAWRFEKPYLPLLLEQVDFPQEVLYFLEGWQWTEVLDHPVERWLPPVLTALNRLGVRPADTSGESAAGNALGHDVRAAGAAAAGARPAAPTAASPAVARGERRRVTAVACNLLDTVSMDQHGDPEEFQTLVQGLQRVCLPIIERAGGTVVQNRGDSLLVYFGYPVAHEDAAHRAVRAALQIAEAAHQYALPSRAEGRWRIAARVGVHTGLVVTDEGDGSLPPISEISAVVSQLPAIASPGTVVMTVTTERLVRGLVHYSTVDGSGVATGGTPVFLVRGEAVGRDRIDAPGHGGLPALVGRAQEVELLHARWQQAREGHGQVVLISGEAGIGKSRLLRALRDRLVDERYLRWEFRGSQAAQHSPLYPVIDLLSRQTGMQREDANDERVRKLEDLLLSFGLSLPEVAPLLAALLALPLPARYPSLSLTPAQQKQQTFEALLSLLLAASDQQPLLFAVEDLHWLDPSTLQLLDLVIEQAHTTHMLVVMTARPEFQPPWSNVALTHLRLDRLTPEQAEAMTARVAGGKALPPEILRQVAARADGVPLFVEELTQSVLESGLLRETDGRFELVAPLSAQAIPATLHDLLMTRLDRLDEAKEIAQVGAVLGRRFSHELLEAVTATDAATLERGLDRLVDAGLLFRRGIGAQALYTFKHALIRDAAYESLVRRRRQAYHQQAANALLTRFPEVVAAQPELVAQHFTAAGRTGEAVDAWLRAGARAAERAASLEALAHFDLALQLIHQLPPGDERDRQELRLQVRRGGMLRFTRGMASPAVAEAYGRARALSRLLGDSQDLSAVLTGLYSYHLVHDEYAQAGEVAAELLATADAHADNTEQMLAHRAVGAVLFHTGRQEEAITHLREALARYNEAEHSRLAAVYGMDPAGQAASFLAMALWVTGRPDEALEQVLWALHNAERLNHPPSIAMSLTWEGFIGTLARDWMRVRSSAPRLIELADSLSAALFSAAGRFWLATAIAFEGEVTAGIVLMNAASADWRRTGAFSYRPIECTLLAELTGLSRSLDEGLDLLDRAEQVVETTNERFTESEIYRVRGLLLARREDGAAETVLQRALATAGEQGAQMLALRAAATLAALWRDQGRLQDARLLLQEALGRIEGGGSSYDVVTATSLLAALG